MIFHDIVVAVVAYLSLNVTSACLLSLPLRLWPKCSICNNFLNGRIGIIDDNQSCIQIWFYLQRVSSFKELTHKHRKISRSKFLYILLWFSSIWWMFCFVRTYIHIPPPTDDLFTRCSFLSAFHGPLRKSVRRQRLHEKSSFSKICLDHYSSLLEVLQPFKFHITCSTS